MRRTLMLGVSLLARNTARGLSLHATAGGSKLMGARETRITEVLADAFLPQHLEVINESHGQLSDESHFKVVVVSDAFEGLPTLKRHRMIIATLSDGKGNLGFHSLAIGAAKTEAEWDKESGVASSPKCAGGDGLKKKP